MHTKRLFLESLEDRHLTLLLKVLEYSYDVTIEGWLADMQSGLLAVFEIEERALIGLRKFDTHLYVEFLVGQNLKPFTDEMVAWVKEQAQGKRIEAIVTRPGLVRYYEKLGFKPLGMWMRLSNG